MDLSLPFKRSQAASSLGKKGSQVRSKSQASTQMPNRMLSSCKPTKTENFKPVPKNRSYSIDSILARNRPIGSAHRMSVSFRRNSTVKGFDASGLGIDSGAIPFAIECFSREREFLAACQEGKLESASQIIFQLLNYSVDLGDKELFMRVLWSLAELHYLCDDPEKSMRYFVVAQESAVLLKMYRELVQALLGISKCCDQVNYFCEGIKVLKKALDYAWLNGDQDLELIVYDEIGKKYYRQGNMEKAK